MSTLDLILAITAGVAAIVGILIGIRLGKSAGQAEGGLLRERIGSLEAEKAKLAIAGDELRADVTSLTGELRAAEANLAAERANYSEMESRIERSFGDLAAKALSANNKSFLDLAQEKLGAQNAEAKRDLADKENAIKDLIDPLGKSLNKLDEQTRAMEEKHIGSYSEVKALVETMQKSIPPSLDALRGETSQLVSALRSPKTRGDWGQEQLRRCVEFAGMVKYCSFHEQVSTRDDNDQLLRPDLTVQLPNGRTIVVDAKTPSDLFSGATEIAGPEQLKARLVAHALRVKKHLNDLSSKAYWKQFEQSPDFVVCFLPSEALFSAALEGDPELIKYGASQNVVLAAPTTIIALLKAIAYGFQQSQVTENAKAIQETGHKIYEKLVVAAGHVSQLGNALSRSVDFYNKFLGSIEGKGGVFYHGRHLGELVHSEGDLPEIKTLQPGVNNAQSEEWAQPLFALAAEDEANGDGSEA